MQKRLQNIIMKLLDENSGGVKLTQLVTDIVADKGRKFELENIEKAIDELVKLGKIQSIEYVWHNRLKYFICLKG